MSDRDWQLQKRPTRLPGLDHATDGGLPDGQATLVLGGAGSGKSVLCLQILARAVEQDAGGVFVTFEESPGQIRRNADSFRWGRLLNDSDAWSIIDARMHPGAQTAGEFDIDALLAAIGSASGKTGGPWVVIDGIDQLLQHQPDPLVAVDQVRQLNEWCENEGRAMILSGKVSGKGLAPVHLDGIEFLLPTSIVLSATMIDRRLIRSLRIAKYRGSGHCPDEMPLVMNDDGIQLPYHEAPAMGEMGEARATMERVSTGVPRLDMLLAGGPYRGSITLISGRPGTSKSTLAASFAEAAAERGELALYVSFDELQGPYVRNLQSVGIDLQSHIDAGRIRFCALSGWSSLVSEHFLVLRRLLDEFEPDCLVIDPVSALLKATGAERPRAATECILELARRRNITTLMTSLVGENDPEGESTIAHVSTIADTWIVLDYNVRAGERNRSLSIVKSRGSGHSNQQRELVLSECGIDLADVYEFGSEVLMGSARAQREIEEHTATGRREMERAQRRQDLARRVEQARSEMERLQAELGLEEQDFAEADRLGREYTEQMQRRRNPDATPPDNGEPDRETDDRGRDQ